MNLLIIPTTYLGPIQLYAYIYKYHHIVEDRHEHFVKQTYRNRCYIATPTGAQALTIPVVREGASHTTTEHVRISNHGNWKHLHWNAITSAYESSPYFEYYMDDFLEVFNRPYEYLTDFNEALRNLVLSLLSLETPVNSSLEYINTATLEMPYTDLRPLLSPKVDLSIDSDFSSTPYYQVFTERAGFIPNLSIIDLLFNLGPESRMVLKDCLKGMKKSL